jgi:predicted PurR-regulated permease PerM
MAPDSDPSRASSPSLSYPESKKVFGQTAANAPQTGVKPAGVESIASSVIEEAEILHASLKAGSVAQIVVAIIAVVGLLYLLKFVMVTALVALLIAFILEPLVDRLSRIGLPRAMGSFVAVVLLAAAVGAMGYFFLNRAVDFAAELPKYSERIQFSLREIQGPLTKLDQSTRSMISQPHGGPEPVPVEVQEAPIFSRLVTANGGAVKDFVLAVGFIPFLVYFMLTWKEHAHSATVALLPVEHRLTAHRTVARISAMIRGFVVGNVIVGLIGAAISIAIFWRLGIPYFYFLGAISGFVSLIPSVGAFLALLPPLVAGIGVLNKIGVVIVLLAVVGTHLVMMNLLYPKLVGKRVRLNPLAVVLSLLFWVWIWGAMGLILAVPIVGAAKIMCDHVDSLRGLGAWLGLRSTA